MDGWIVKQIGKIQVKNGEFCIALDKNYAPALRGLDGFSHINVLWWFSTCDNHKCRSSLEEKAPYKNSPPVLGTFATRSPLRPNPIAVTCSQVTYIDHTNGVLGLAYIDADDGSPVLDIKPYIPSLDRVEKPTVPDWCAHWPKSHEESGNFDWANEFNF